MELKDYATALRRHWRTWLCLSLAGTLLALLALTESPRVYQATAQVFVSSRTDDTMSAQFVNARVKSYPDVAVSAAVLKAVRQQLGLQESLQSLQSRVSASNPVDTSEVDIVANSSDPQEAASIANAVAEQFTVVLAQLERPASGALPVAATVTDPAAVPSAPVSPNALYTVALGLACGLLLGVAVAIGRSRTDTALYTDADVRAAWGRDDVPEVFQSLRRPRRAPLTGRPAGPIARRLESLADDRPVEVCFVSILPWDRRTAVDVAEDVAEQLTAHGVPNTVAEPAVQVPGAALAAPGGVRIHVGDPVASVSAWRQVAADTRGVILIVPSGTVAATEIREMRNLFEAARIDLLAMVVVPRRRRRRGDHRHAAPLRREAPPSDNPTAQELDPEDDFAVLPSSTSPEAGSKSRTTMR